MTTTMVWPERPLCHDGDWQARQYAKKLDVGWREPHGHREGSPYEETYRTCWFCGSIHPEDLWRLLTDGTGVELHRADRKYRWPHKFYVAGIPNPIADDLTESGGRSCGFRPTLDALDEWVSDPKEREATDEELFAAGWQIRTTTTIDTARNGEGEWERRRYDQVSYYRPSITAAPPTMQAKWYNDHLHDLVATDRATFETFARVIFDHTGVLFSADDDGRLKWRG